MSHSSPSSKLFASAALAGLVAVALGPGARANAERDQVSVQSDVQIVGTRGGGGGGGIAIGSTTLGGSALTMPVEASGAGMIVGRVVDAGTGQPVAGAVVTLGGAFSGGRGRGPMQIVNGSVSFGDPGARTIPRVLTDSEGRFAFRSVPKGSFELTAQKNGYLDGAYGRQRPDGASQQLALEDAERLNDVTLQMFRPAVISGAVVDSRGEPVVGADVRAYRRTLSMGQSRLTPANVSTRSDDRGLYRLAGLTPGEYVIAVPSSTLSTPADFMSGGRFPAELISSMAAASPGQPVNLSIGGGAQVPGDDRFLLQGAGIAPEADGRLMTYPTVYYPSAGSVTQAETVALKSGEERAGINIALALQPTANIIGRVVGPQGPVASLALTLVPGDTGDLSNDPSVATAITAQDGAFAFIGVPAGNYVIQGTRIPPGLGRGGPGGEMRVVMFTATTQAGGGEPPIPTPNRTTTGDTTVLWTAMPIAVSGQDITDVSVVMNEGIRISGRLEFEGALQRPAGNQLTSMIVTASATDGRNRAGVPPGRLDQEGRFTMPGIVPGRYLFNLANAPQGWVLKSITAGGVDVADLPLDVGARATQELVVTLTDKVSTLGGSVRGSEGRPDSTAAVIVFPADNRAWRENGLNPRRVRMVRTGRDGNFVVGAIPPGDYHLVAIGDDVAGEWQDPRFLEMLTRESTPVSIGEGEKVTRDLTRRNVQPIGGAPTPASPTAAEVLRPSPMPVAAWTGAADSGADQDGADDGDHPGGPFVDETPVQQSRDARVDPARRAPETATATVSGVVMLEGENARPVRRARVSLRAADQRVERAVMTDDEGRFTFAGVPAGRYAVSASKPAHITGFFGSSRPGRGPGSPLAVAAGQNVAGVTVRLAQGGVLSGRIVDDQGAPFPGVGIRLMQYRTVGSERQLVPAALSAGLSAGGGAISLVGGGNATTDDRGDYRIYGLAPGSYIVSAVAPQRGADVRQLSPDDVQRVVADLAVPPAKVPGGGAAPAPDPKPLGGRSVGYAPIYYPGTPAASEARAVTVTAGVELNGIDMSVRYVPTARISGTIVGPDGQPAAGAQVMVLQEDRTSVLVGGLTSMARTGPDGTFSTGALAPGRYVLSVRSGGGDQIMQIGGGGAFVARRAVETQAAGDQPAARPQPLWAQETADLNGEDVSGVTMQLRPGMTVAGQLVFPAGAAGVPEDLSRVRVLLQPASTSQLFSGSGSTRVEADGSFVIEGVVPGSYRLNAVVPSTGFTASSRWTMASVVAGDRDVMDSGFVVAPGSGVKGLSVNFTDRTGEIGGRLTDPSGEPISDLTIVVFSADRASWVPGSRRIRPPAQPGSDGMFSFTGLLAGDYYLAAVTELEPDAISDPAVLEQIAAAAIKVTLAPGEKKVQDIKIAGGGE